MPALAIALQLVAITHATLIDPDVANVRRDMTIVVRGTRVTQVGASAATAVPAGARVIDATGKYVIPGMWDMHVHVEFPGGRALLSLFVAHGVTYAHVAMSNFMPLNSMAIGLDFSDTNGTLTLKRNDSPAWIVFNVSSSSPE